MTTKPIKGGFGVPSTLELVPIANVRMTTEQHGGREARSSSSNLTESALFKSSRTSAKACSDKLGDMMSTAEPGFSHSSSLSTTRSRPVFLIKSIVSPGWLELLETRESP